MTKKRRKLPSFVSFKRRPTIELPRSTRSEQSVLWRRPNARLESAKEKRQSSSLRGKGLLNRNKELAEARRLQALEKEKYLQNQAINDRDEFQKIIEAQKELRDMELNAERERHSKVILANLDQRARYRDP